MNIIDTILSNKLDKDIIEIIMTYLWKERFNLVIKEASEVNHYFHESNIHEIYMDNIHLTYPQLIEIPSGTLYRTLYGWYSMTKYFDGYTWHIKKGY